MAGRKALPHNQMLADQVLALLVDRGPLTTREISSAVGSIDRWVEHICFDGMDYRHEGFHHAQLLRCEPTGRFTFTSRFGTVPLAAHLLRRPCYPHDIYPSLIRLARTGQITKAATTAVFRTVLWSAAGGGTELEELERLWALS